MAVRPIILWPESWLNQKSTPVLPDEFGSEQLSELAVDLFETMQAARGLGLSAPQLGVHKRVIAVPDPTQAALGRRATIVLCNPVLSELSEGKNRAPEGCLSLPSIELWMERYTSVKVTAKTIDGKDYESVWTGLPAVAVQHECDHLEGETIADGIGQLHKQLLRKKLKKTMRNLERAREQEEQAKHALIRKAMGPRDANEYTVAKTAETKAAP